MDRSATFARLKISDPSEIDLFALALHWFGSSCCSSPQDPARNRCFRSKLVSPLLKHPVRPGHRTMSISGYVEMSPVLPKTIKGSKIDPSKM
ncbi:hypothetical protein CC77DRAFT_1026767, partial [Alternaria alternata]